MSLQLIYKKKKSICIKYLNTFLCFYFGAKYAPSLVISSTNIIDWFPFDKRNWAKFC